MGPYTVNRCLDDYIADYKRRGGKGLDRLEITADGCARDRRLRQDRRTGVYRCDVHTHDDRALLASPDMAVKASQGVATVIMGNCGVSLAPPTLDRRRRI